MSKPKCGRVAGDLEIPTSVASAPLLESLLQIASSLEPDQLEQLLFFAEDLDDEQQRT